MSHPCWQRGFERGALRYRTAGTGDAFQSIPLASSTSNDFFGVIPDTAVTERGVEYYVEVGNGPFSATQPPSAPDAVFRLAVRFSVTMNAVARPTSRGGFLAGREIVVEISLPLGAEFLAGSLHYREGGQASYRVDSLRLDPRRIPLAVIPETVVGARGVEFWAECSTATRRLSFPATEPSRMPALIRTSVFNLAEDASHPGGRYRLLTVPLDFGRDVPRTLEAMLSDETQFGPYNPLRWRSFRYMPDSLRNVELSVGDTLFRPEPGRAFWLISREPHRVDTAPVEGLSTPTGEEYPIVLAPGWNQIGSPFAFGVAWSRVRKSSAAIGDPVAFNPALGTIGDYADATPAVLAPFEGYFVENTGAQAETLRVPAIEALATSSRVVSDAVAASPEAPVLTPQPAARALASVSKVQGAGPGSPSASTASQDSWRLRLRARGAEALDGANLLGVDPEATEEYDPLDQPKPPATPGPWARLSFVHPAWRDRPGAYRHDLRAPGAEGHVWDLEVLSAKSGEPITLEPVAEGPLPRELALRLLDREQMSVVEVRAPGSSLTSYRMLSAGPHRPYRLTLLAGSAEYVARVASQALEIPTHLVLEQNAPNPFSVRTRIRFGLPRSEPVTLEVYNVLGERVASLLKGAPLPPGYHTVLWDGTNGAGKMNASGVYFYRMATAVGALTQRIVLVR